MPKTNSVEQLDFRKLKIDEIDVRVQQVFASETRTGAILLLYKDARCDMNILDETVGAMNWQRQHLRDNANCIVSIYDSKKGAWVSKEDTGTESFTEKEKGLASDSFKRACFNWGIGRELYTAPFIWVNLSKEDVDTSKGTARCNKKFVVKHIAYADNRICELIICDAKGKQYFAWKDEDRYESPDYAKIVQDYLNTHKEEGQKWLYDKYKVNSVKELPPSQVYKIYEQIVNKQKK